MLLHMPGGVAILAGLWIWLLISNSEQVWGKQTGCLCESVCWLFTVGGE